MAAARRVSLYEREVRVRLAPAGLELLFGEARVLTEGDADGDRWCGSTMVTIDLARVAPRVSDECDVAAARRLARLMADDDRVRDRARRLAIAEAERAAGAPLAPVVDLHIHPRGRTLHLDLDVEAPRPASTAPQARRKA